MQAQTEQGVIGLLVVDFRPVGAAGGELRGYVEFDAARLAEQGPEPTLYGLFGKGYLAITFDRQAAGPEGQGRYQGIVPLEGDSLAEAARLYFEQSEQLPTLVRVAVSPRGDDGRGCVAGGLLVQHLPDGEEGRDRLHTRLDHPEWEHVRILSETITGGELVDRRLPLEEIAWRLFHEEREVRIDEGVALARGCRCDEAHIRSVIGRFPADERAEMADETGRINVDCAFCSRLFPIALESLPG
jgi:molecular chaperone Hsp33